MKKVNQNEIEKFSSEEFLELSKALEEHHSIFYKLWNMGKPVFSNEFPRATVYFDEYGKVMEFHVNPEFWNNLTQSQKLFVLCHECLHVVLNHGLRMSTLDKNLQTVANYAQDIVINHKLVNNYGFIREEIDPNNIYCWVDKFFQESENIKTDECFEYYFNKLKEREDVLDQAKCVDSHEFSDFSDVLKELGKELSPDETKNIQKFIESNSDEAGKVSASTWLPINVGNVQKKRKWETVIKQWSIKYTKDSEKEIDQWTTINRRFALISKDLIIPTEYEIDESNEEKCKIKVWFFQDTSGSCVSLATRFFKAAKSLPEDRFEVKMHCFDTSVYETDLKTNKLYGFGGTTFSCIESYIRKNIKSERDYPKAVFVCTDGYGNNVYPIKPKNWYWFLSTGYDKCIPKDCHRFLLKDFE